MLGQEGDAVLWVQQQVGVLLCAKEALGQVQGLCVDVDSINGSSGEVMADGHRQGTCASTCMREQHKPYLALYKFEAQVNRKKRWNS